MNIAWNPPGLSSAIDRLMDFWDENVSVPIRRAQPVQPPQPEPPVAVPPSNAAHHHEERHGQQGSAGEGCISALAVLAGG
ncbi:hypothetical protein [Noviherbaspirillum aerium]|uniref:hypothetical protein n=1 Tax=Noviherbaspirillum aerium TaxID=2588497 RepID=UPI00124C06FB|nr:hypothetical protein [Noviherbaspirillum aerium]